MFLMDKKSLENKVLWHEKTLKAEIYSCWGRLRSVCVCGGGGDRKGLYS